MEHASNQTPQTKRFNCREKVCSHGRDHYPAIIHQQGYQLFSSGVNPLALIANFSSIRAARRAETPASGKNGEHFQDLIIRHRSSNLEFRLTCKILSSVDLLRKSIGLLATASETDIMFISIY